MRIHADYQGFGNRSITLEQNSDSLESNLPFDLTITEWLEGPFSFEVPVEKVAPLLHRIPSLRITPIATCPFGVDGVTVKLTFEVGFASSSFTWWCEVDAGWEALPKIVQDLEKLATEYLGRELRNL